MSFIPEKTPFVSLPTALKGRIDPYELAVLWVLQSYYPNIWPSYSTIAKDAKIGRNKVVKVIKSLFSQMTLPNSHIPSFIDSGFISRSGYFCLVISARSSLTKRAIFDLGNKYFIRSRKVSEPILISKTGLVNDKGSNFRACWSSYT